MWFNLRVKDHHGEKVLLLIDGFSAHEVGIDRVEARGHQLPFVEIAFLPANATSKCQPLDQGIIRTFKAYYRKQWLSYIVSQLDAEENPFESTDLLHTLKWSQKVWERDVSKASIANCWVHSRVLAPEPRPITERRLQEWQAELEAAGKSEEEVLNVLLSQIKTLQEKRVIRVAPTLSQLLNPIGEDVVDSTDDETLLNTIAEAHMPATESDEGPDREITPVPIEDALHALETLKNGFCNSQMRS